MKTWENRRYIFEPESGHVWDFPSYSEWEYFNSVFSGGSLLDLCLTAELEQV